MQDRLFRKSALERLTSPERLDTLMQVTQPRGWFAFSIILIMLIVFGVWAFAAKIDETVAAEGELLHRDGELYTVVYVLAGDAQAIEPGMEAQVTLVTISAQEYGYLTGTVASIDSQPTSDALASDIFSHDAAYAITIELALDLETPTGYVWSIGEGPDVTLRSGVGVTANVILGEKRPISLAFPVFD